MQASVDQITQAVGELYLQHWLLSIDHRAVAQRLQQLEAENAQLQLTLEALTESAEREE